MASRGERVRGFSALLLLLGGCAPAAAFPNASSLIQLATPEAEKEILIHFPKTNRDCIAIVSSNTLNGGGNVEAAVATERPLLLAEHIEAAAGCGLLVRLGHDCCSFAASAAATWAEAGGGRRLVFRLESSARARDCVECVAAAAHAHCLDARILKGGRLQAAIAPHHALQARPLKLAAIVYPPFVTFPEAAIASNVVGDVLLSKRQQRLLGGVEWLLVRTLCRRFKLRLQVLLRREGELWGVANETGASGVLGLLAGGGADVGVGGFNWDARFSGRLVLQVRPYRRSLVRFLSPHAAGADGGASGGAASSPRLARPLSGAAWAAVAGVGAAGAAALAAALRTERRRADDGAACLVAVGVLAQQGDLPKVWRGGVRGALLLWLQLGAVMVGACYSALLVAVLTVVEAAPQLDTLQQLAASGLAYTDVDDVWPGQLALSDDVSVRQLMARFEMSRSWRHLQQRLRTGHFTYTAECLDSGFLCLQEPLPPDLLRLLHLSKEHVLASEVGLVVRRPLVWLKEALEADAARLLEAGVLGAWEEAAAARHPDAHMGLVMRKQAEQAAAGGGHVVLGLVHLAGPFLGLAAGLLLAAASFAVEILVAS